MEKVTVPSEPSATHKSSVLYFAALPIIFEKIRDMADLSNVRMTGISGRDISGEMPVFRKDIILF